MPGRPRKWQLTESGYARHYEETRARRDQDGSDASKVVHQSNGESPYQQDTDIQHTSSIIFANESSTTASAGLLPTMPKQWQPREAQDMAFDYEDSSILPLLDFNSSVQLDSLPLDPFRACLSNHDMCDPEPTELSSNTSVTSVLPEQTCDCAHQVFEIIRSLQNGTISHSTVGTLRLGTSIFEMLLSCPICYDTSKPPRITLQNVLLLGRLSIEVTTGYQNYLKWLREYCADLAMRKADDTVYLAAGDDISPGLGLNISSDKLFDLIIDGLKNDASKLSKLGWKLAVRQHNRHLVGHEDCPDGEGRCLKEQKAVNPDPSDICPQSAGAKALTPCYRIVDEVRARIEKLKKDLT